MLQQTQVATVIPYYSRFTERFPDVGALAAADLDQVLALWAGLGYYARARNMHRTAGIIVNQYDRKFPQAMEEVMSLPGIGRSTAAAILALSRGERHAILDGNVKRVLSRCFRVEGITGSAATIKHLWKIAERLTPDTRVDDYTQAIMDLGAVICTRSKPMCDACPVAGLCEAHIHQVVSRYPLPRAKRTRPKRCAEFLLLLTQSEEVLLERRPPTGIWGGLWCLPQTDDSVEWIEQRLGHRDLQFENHPPFIHQFTHFDLEIRPIGAMVEREAMHLADDDALRWHNREDLDTIGLPAPIRKLFDTLNIGNTTN
ncbi:MAG: A/G-specific adenine glycosylase [marine bacterium B5-7]|nr:MAG: A/G-specific adenine glycosylase [marine bacterium B5-7]